MRKLFVSMVAAALACVAAANAVVGGGTMTLEFGKVRQPDGTMLDVKGAKIPFRVERIEARRAAPAFRNDIASVLFDSGRGGRTFGPENTFVFNNDNPGQYFISDINEFSIPSAADGVRLVAGGQGKPWQQLTQGMDIQQSERYLIRWRVFTQLVTGRGANQSTFDGEIADFGGYFNPTLSIIPFTPGTYKLTFDIAVVAVAPTGQQTYVAQQFRQPQTPENGEGPFLGTVQNVFSGGGPSVGTSEDTFWFDGANGGSDGLYDETEVEQLGTDPQNLIRTTLLLGITATQTPTETFYPVSFSWFRGRAVSGTFINLWFKDQQYVVGLPGFTLNATEAPSQLIVNGVVPTTNPLSMRFSTTLRSNTGGMTGYVDLFNYTTNQWVFFGETPVGTSDVDLTVIVTGTPAQFVSSTNDVRARIRLRRTGFTTTANPQTRVDLANWIITR